MICRKRRPIYFAQGFFSLALALPLGLFVLRGLHVFEPVRTMEITCYDPNAPAYANIPKIPLPPKGRQFETFVLTGDKQHDKVVMNKSRSQIKRLLQSPTFSKGIHYYFDDHSRYESFVQALDICNKENVKRYVFYKNDIWIF